MPRNGSGVYSKPAGTTAVPDTTIESAKYNSTIDDLVQDANTARPITAGGTGATSAASARTNLAVPGTATVNTFTATQKWAKGADVASASTLTLGDDGNYFDITGTTAITAITTKGVGTRVLLQFDAALTLTHHATDLILPSGLSITTAAGDHAEFVEYASGDWRCVNYVRAADTTLDVASATTTDIGAGGRFNIRITGTTTITGFGTAPQGTLRFVRMADALTLTHNGTSLILPGSANITTAANDCFIARSLGSGNWLVMFYQRADGTAVSNSSVFTKSYESSEQTMTSAGQLILAHGLGVKPKLITCTLVCKTAELGYSVDDEVEVYLNADNGSNAPGTSMRKDATNLTIRFSSSAACWVLPRADNGQRAGLTNTNWRLVVRAFA